jgi:Putative transposase/Transposase zinc-binding domain
MSSCASTSRRSSRRYARSAAKTCHVRYVEQELRRYLRCGLLLWGFVRVMCPTCRDEILVAYSCKCRGACPSCSARRMCGSAAHLVDHVLPDVPVRQWVLTAPHDVRSVLALRPAALTACARIFVEEIARWQKQTAKEQGIEDGATGAVTFVQRFSSTLGTFVHFHVVVPDGVFTRTEGAEAAFHEGRAPSREEVAAVAARVATRMTRWLRRRVLVDERSAEERSNEAPELSPLEACMQLSLFGGAFLRLADDGVPVPLEDERLRISGKSPWAAEVAGFNVHAGITVRAGDREGLERLCRYGARPPFSLERLSILPDGRVAYRLRRPRRNGATHLVLEPLHFMARLASLIPPPRYPLLRLSGVFAPHSPWRAGVVPRGPAASPTMAPPKPPTKKKKKKSRDAASIGLVGGVDALLGGVDAVPSRSASASDRATANGACTSLGTGITRRVGARIDWANLLRRIYLEDVLACPCGGRRRIVADISEPSVILAILRHLGFPTEPPPIARARSPSFDAA